MGQRNVHHSRIQYFHKCTGHDGDGDYPGINGGASVLSLRRHGLILDSGTYSVAAPALGAPFCFRPDYLTNTVGYTDMPGRKRCSGSSRFSRTILTGTRCTTLT